MNGTAESEFAPALVTVVFSEPGPLGLSFEEKRGGGSLFIAEISGEIGMIV